MSIDLLVDFLKPDLPIFVGDFGNNKLKIAVDPQPRNKNNLYNKAYRIVDHYVYQVTESIWRDEHAKATMHNRDEEYAFVEYEGSYFIIGKKIIRPGVSDARKQGDQKLVKDYIYPILASMLMLMYDGNPPDAISFAFGHPPMQQAVSRRIAKDMEGILRFKTPKGSVRVNIKTAYGFTEMMGSVNRIALRIDTNKNGLAAHPIKRNANTIVLDLGGGSFDIASLGPGGHPSGLINTTFIGINSAIQNFQTLAKNEFEAELRDARSKVGFSEAQIIECFRTDDKSLMIGPKLYDASAIFEEAIDGLIMAIDRAFDDMLGDNGLAGYQYALVTGGGGDILFNTICEKLLGFFANIKVNGQMDFSQNVFLAGEPGSVILSNAIGTLDTMLFVKAGIKAGKI